MNFVFYIGVVLIWGTTWFAILFQLGEVDPLVSIIYRFSMAALILMAYCLAAGRRMRFSLKSHLFMALMGFLLFSLNYWLFYLSELYLASGLVAVVFSTLAVFNILFGALFLGSPVRPRVLWGALLGLAGIGILFRPELASFSFSDRGVIGLSLSLAATASSSLGNITSARNQRDGIPVVQANAWGMTYGTAFMVVSALVMGKKFTFEVTFPYFFSLFYLALFGSVFAFGMYLTLIGRIGADRAAYSSLLYPLVALFLSLEYEGYRATLPALAGVLLILLGNYLVLGKGGKHRDGVRA